MSAFLLRCKANYFGKMRAYPQFPLWISKALAKIYILNIMLIWHKKNLCIYVGTVLNDAMHAIAGHGVLFDQNI